MSADERWHGTANGYTNHRCRCIECCAANTFRMKEYRRLWALNIPERVHGSTGGYRNYSCRCPACKAAVAADARASRRRRAETKAGVR